MNNQAPLTNTATHIASHHGNISRLASSRIMGIDSHESHPLERDKDKDPMDIFIDRPHNDESKGSQADRSLGSPLSAFLVPPIMQEPSSEGKSSGISVKQDGKTSTHAPSKPYLTQDLLSVFGLQPLVASVARTDPITGEKINKMRKSYEGKLKALKLAGRNRAVKHEIETNDAGNLKEGRLLGLLELANWPEEEWHNTKVMGREVQKGISNATLAKLEKATHMLPGPVPKQGVWDELIGLERTKPDQASKKTENPKKQAGLDAARSSKAKLNGIAGQSSSLQKPSHPSNLITVKANGLTNGARVDPGTSSPIDRPRRTGKKRRYDDHSFDGYGDGFMDDDGGEGGYSSGEGSRKSTTSKRRKKDAYGNPSGLDDRPVGYGMSIGVGSGIGAYGR